MEDKFFQLTLQKLNDEIERATNEIGTDKVLLEEESKEAEYQGK